MAKKTAKKKEVSEILKNTTDTEDIMSELKEVSKVSLTNVNLIDSMVQAFKAWTKRVTEIERQMEKIKNRLGL